MSDDFKPTGDQIKAVMQSTPVRVRLDDTARVAASEAEADARSLGMDDFNPRTTQGTRPGGRPFSRVAVAKDGDGGVQNRLDVLGRVAGRNNAPK